MQDRTTIVCLPFTHHFGRRSMYSNLAILWQEIVYTYLGENYCSIYILLCNNYSETLWLPSILLLYLWILWVRNLERTQRGQLVSVLQSLRPYLGTLKDWGWFNGWGQKASKGSLTLNVGDECWPSAGTSTPHLGLLARTYICGHFGFLRMVAGFQQD